MKLFYGFLGFLLNECEKVPGCPEERLDTLCIN
jgi:hypothetical protein